jgi:mTERF domain-containing protein
LGSSIKENSSKDVPANFVEEEDWLDDDEELFEVEAEDLEEVEVDTAVPRNSSFNVLSLEDISQTFSPNVSYFYLKNELGISEEGMWRITYEASSALGMTATTIRHKVDVLRNTMNLTDEDVRSLLERHPTILHLSADKNISPTLLFLIRTLDLGRDELRSLVLASPCVLTYSRANLKSKIKFFTEIMRFTIAECRELFLSEQKLLRAGVKTGLIPKMRFLVRDMEIPLDELRRIVQKHPRILLYSLDGNLVPKLVYYFIMTLQMETSQLRKILLAYPAILDKNLDRTILPITNYFLNDLEYSPFELRSIVLKFPRLMSHSLKKIKHVVGYLRYEVGLTSSPVKRVLYQAPQMIGLNTEGNLKVKVDYLKETLDLDDEELRIVVAAMPTLLVLNTERNLQPKVDYLLSVLRTHQNLRETVIRLPTLLGYSLEQRIRPRMQAITAAGLDPSSITVGIPMKQDKFESWLQRRRDKRLREEAALEEEKQTPDDSLSGRIIHWSRERRQRLAE